MNKWFTQAHFLKMVFCESLVFDFEYFNVITSVAFILLPLWHAYHTTWFADHTAMLFAFLVCVGVGSIGNHGTHTLMWGAVDVLSMMLLVYGGLFILLQTIFYVRNMQFDCEIATVCMVLAVVTGAQYLFGNSRATTILALMVGLPAVVEALILFVFWRWFFRTHQLEIRDRQAYWIVVTGQLLEIVAAIFWITTEPFCQTDPDTSARYVFGHAWWHLDMALGIFYQLEFLIYVRMFYFAKHNLPENPATVEYPVFVGWCGLPVAVMRSEHVGEAAIV